MMRLTTCLTLLAVSLAATPVTLTAQESRVDSLEARIRELEARLDSLLNEIARGRADSAAKSAAAELEALRAAARAAAGEPEQDTAAASRTSNLNILNPEISATGDVLSLYVDPAGEPGYLTAVPREFEFSFEAALDPYTRTKIFVTHEEELEIAGLAEEDEEGAAHPAVDIEEGYIYWIGLPGFGLKVGKFRQQIGLYNRWHTHALPEVDRPLPTVAFLGHDGLIQTGLSAALPTLTLGISTQTFTIELARASNDALFDGGKKLSFLGHFNSFWDISAASYLQLGAAVVYGENDDAALTSRLYQLDFSYRWRPPGRALYRDFTLKGEWYFAEKDYGNEKPKGDGGYLQANYRLDRRWVLGARADYVDSYGDEPEILQIVPTVTWWQSEWVRLRLQYNYVKPKDGSAGHTVIAQVVWAVGPHKHETY
ncbi:MAG: hypothetical protein PVI01_09075 [Gemmatimonadales bacterium]|jgi:hypothetical protein